MNKRDKGLKALGRLFPDGHVNVFDRFVDKENSAANGTHSMTAKPCYEYSVTFEDGSHATAAGCWFGDEFFAVHSDESLLKAFELLFVRSPA